MESIPESSTPVLVVDDDEGLLLSIKATLVSAGLPEPAMVSDSRRVLEMMKTGQYPLVMLDLMMPNMSGMEVLKQIKQSYPSTDCVIVSAIDEVPAAVQAMSLGALDYIVKPLNRDKLIALIESTLERHALRSDLVRLGREKVFSNLKHPEAFSDLIAEDEAMALIFHQIEAVAETDYSVVINGESGTGKEMVARTIHRLSGRKDAPFYAVNMAAFSKTIFEDEFFGHAKGAYTDAGATGGDFLRPPRAEPFFWMKSPNWTPPCRPNCCG
jgi:DNA-binding NtrC family response regulator